MDEMRPIALAAREYSRTASARKRQWSLREVTLILLTAGLAAFSRYTLSPLQEAVSVSLHFSDNQMALLQGPALAFPIVIGAIPLGRIVDRHSRVRLIVLLSLLDFGATVASSLAQTLPQFLIARALVGFAVPSICVALFSLLSDIFPVELRGRANTALVVAQYSGLSVAFALGGVLLKNADGPDHWRSAMLWLSVPLLFGTIAALAMREPPRVEVGDSTFARTDGLIRELWRYRALLLTLVVGLLMGDVGVYTVLSWAAPALSRGFHIGADRVGVIVGVSVFLSGIAGPVLGGVIADLCGRAGGPRRTLLALSFLALLTVPVAFFPVMPNLALATIMLMLFSIFGGALLVGGTTLFTVLIPNDIRGTSLAISFAVQNILGIGLMPLAVSALSTGLGGPNWLGTALALITAASGIAGAGIFLWGSRKAEVQLAAAS